MKAKAEKAELALKEHEKVWEATNEDLLRRVELLSKFKAKKEEQHAVEITKVIVEVKDSVVVVVWEAEIKLTEDVANAIY